MLLTLLYSPEVAVELDECAPDDPAAIVRRYWENIIKVYKDETIQKVSDDLEFY